MAREKRKRKTEGAKKNWNQQRTLCAGEKRKMNERSFVEEVNEFRMYVWVRVSCTNAFFTGLNRLER